MTEEKSNQIHSQDDIELIPGNTNIVLIAPHGHDKDDTNTGRLVRLIAEQSGSYAIINEYYRRTDDKNPVNKNNRRINVNNIGQVETNLQEEFLDPLIKYKTEIVEKYGNPLIFWIHGAKDKRIEGDISEKDGVNPKDVKVLVGWGQKTGDDRHTADEKTVNNLIDSRNANGLNAVLANPDKKANPEKGIRTYCGRGSNNMNQLFRVGKYKDQKVQSLQLEFRWTGCRDTDESIETTARKLAYAISALVPPAEKNLVETAYQKLSNIFSKNYEQALMEAGQYIVRTFYGGEEGIENQAYDENLAFSDEVIERARKKQSPKEETLKQLYDKIGEDGTSKAPSRAWIYNAVNLIVQWHDVKHRIETSFYTYRTLFLSHKVALLKVKDLTKKQELIEEEAKNPSTVKDFIQKVQKLVPPGTDKPLYLPSLLRKPDELIKPENAEKLTIEALKSKQDGTLKNLKKITKEQHQNVQTEIDDLKNYLETRQKSLEKYVEVQGNIEKAIQHKQKVKKRKELRNTK